MTDEPIINHEEAWDLAHMKLNTSNMARCYLDLRRVAQEVVDTCGSDSHPPLRRLREICETNLD